MDASQGIVIPWGAIGASATAIGGILVYVAKKMFERSLDQRDRRREREEDLKDAEAKRIEAERRLETKMILRGLKTLSDCQYEVVYQMQNGYHNGGLEDCLQNITDYRRDVVEWITDRASTPTARR